MSGRLPNPSLRRGETPAVLPAECVSLVVPRYLFHVAVAGRIGPRVECGDAIHNPGSNVADGPRSDERGLVDGLSTLRLEH